MGSCNAFMALLGVFQFPKNSRYAGHTSMGVPSNFLGRQPPFSETENSITKHCLSVLDLCKTHEFFL